MISTQDNPNRASSARTVNDDVVLATIVYSDEHYCRSRDLKLKEETEGVVKSHAIGVTPQIYPAFLVHLWLRLQQGRALDFDLHLLAYLLLYH